jgi:hypothetical protein
MASLSNQSTYSSLEPHASSQKEASICSILLRVGEISHATQTPPGRKKKNESNQRPLSSCKNQDQREGRRGDKWRRCRAGARPTAPSRTPPPSASPTSTPTSRSAVDPEIPFAETFFVCLRAPKFGQVHPNPSLLVRWNGAVLLVGARICGF